LAVRVRLRIRKGGRKVVTSALVNTGFEADEPQLIVPLPLAEELQLLSGEASIEDFSTAGGGLISGYRIEEPIEVELVLEDREPPAMQVPVTVLPRETEVIMSDKLASDLGIVVLDPWRGIWCLRDELGTKERPSAPVEEWQIRQ